MPRISPTGDVVAGADGHGISINRVQVDEGYYAQPLDATRIIYQRTSDEKLWTYDAVNGAFLQVSGRGANALAAGGGTWMAWLAGVGVYGPDLAPLSVAGLAGVGTDNRGSTSSTGITGVVPVRDLGFGLRFLWKDGTNMGTVPDADPRSVHVLDAGIAVWVQNGQLRTVGLPTPMQQPEAVAQVRALVCDGQWLLLLTLNDRLILRHWDSLKGKVIVPTPTAFNADALSVVPSVIRVASSLGQGERPEDIQWWDVSIDALEDDTGVMTPTLIARPCWLGFFEFAPAPMLPGNCWLSVRPDNPMPICRRGDRSMVAQYVAAELAGMTLEAEVAKARALNPTIPVVPYWTRQVQTGPLPPGDWIGVEAYRGANESPSAFEMRIAIALARCPAAVLIAQCYTSNLNNTMDLRSIPPVMERLARRFPQVKMILPFSGSGRATGLQDHPDVLPLWIDVSDGITGAPPLERIIAPAPTPTPTPTPPPVPEPPPLFRHASRYMPMTKTVALRLGEMFAAIHPADAGKGPFPGWFPVRFSLDNQPDQADCQFQLSNPAGNQRLMLKHATTGCILSADATRFSGDIASEFGGKPSPLGGVDGWDGYEQFQGWTLGSDGISIVVIEYDRDGAKYASACLTVVEL